MTLFKKTVAERERVKLMLGISGVSGSGKTFSALQMAYGIAGDWSKIALADTENKSALYYAGENTGPWLHIDFPSTINIRGAHGYHPDNWTALIEDVEKDPAIEVLILDSISHEWQGRGGCLELVDSIGKGFAAWKNVTPRHNRFIDKMRESRLHIIATMRSVQEYTTETNEKGKTAPKKLGMKSHQREGTDYEFGIIFDIEISHKAHTSKDRTGLFMDRSDFFITYDTGKELVAWSQSGSAPKQKEPEMPILTFNIDDADLCNRLIVVLKKKSIPLDQHEEIAMHLNGKPMTLKSVDEIISQITG